MRIHPIKTSLLAVVVCSSVHAQTAGVTVPLVTGLAVVGSVREPAGDYESVRRVTGIASDRVAFTITGDLPGKDGERARHRSTASRTVLRVDLKSARTIKPRISSGWNADEVYRRHDHRSALAAALTELRTTGHTITHLHRRWHRRSQSDRRRTRCWKMMAAAGGCRGLDRLREETPTEAVSRSGRRRLTVSGTLSSVEPGIVPVSILVNNVVAALPARHIRGKLTGDDGARNADMYVLDDPANPILLQFRVGEDSMTVVRIDWPSASTAEEHGGGARGAETSGRVRDLLRLQQRGDPPAVGFDAQCDRRDDEARSHVEAHGHRTHGQRRRRRVESRALRATLGFGEGGVGRTRNLGRSPGNGRRRSFVAESDECDAGRVARKIGAWSSHGSDARAMWIGDYTYRSITTRWTSRASSITSSLRSRSGGVMINGYT